MNQARKLSSPGSSLRLDAVGCQRRLVTWASTLAVKVDLEFDENSVGDDQLHYVVLPSSDGDRLTLSQRNRDTFALLGAAFELQHSEDENALHIYVTQPSHNEAAELMRSFAAIARKVERSTWPYTISGALVLIGVALLCVSFSWLHTHLHEYEAPWETFFEWAFTLPIVVGDKLRQQFSGVAAAATDASDL
jgi:hypothetical protein